MSADLFVAMLQLIMRGRRRPLFLILCQRRSESPLKPPV
jgi:hypothetical protein